MDAITGKRYLPKVTWTFQEKSTWERGRITSLVLTGCLRLIGKEELFAASEQNTCPLGGKKRPAVRRRQPDNYLVITTAGQFECCRSKLMIKV